MSLHTLHIFVVRACCGKRRGILRGVNEERNILHGIKRRKDNWIGHIWRRNCLLKHDIKGKIEGRIEVTRRRERRHKHLVDDIKEKIEGRIEVT